jgi:transposase InsO family protein
LNGKPDALEGACPVWGGEAGKRLGRALSLTPLWTDESWLYLAVVLDLFSRRVIGWSMNRRMTKELACDAMQMAIN